MSYFAIYNRLGVDVFASKREIVRASRKLFSNRAIKNPDFREDRKRFYRHMLEQHEAAYALFAKVAWG